MSAFLLVTMYLSMAGAALLIEFVFEALHLVPHSDHAQIVSASVRWNYTTILDIIFLTLATLLLIRFFTTGGVQMLRMMNKSPISPSKGSPLMFTHLRSHKTDSVRLTPWHATVR